MLLRFDRAACALALGLLVACGGSQGTGNVDYSVSAEENYKKGRAELEEEDWIAAAKYFAFIKARFPYSKYAVLAELSLADAEFGAERYLQAIDGYKVFIKFHPTHDMVVNGYCAFRIGESYYRMLPDDFWLLPPAHEKDQSATMDAHRELSTFLEKYPKSPYVEKARKRLTVIDRRLAEHEMYVARFYWERDQPMGTVLRLRRLLEKHQGAGYDAEAMLLLGRAYVEVKMPDRARETWQRLIQEHPKSSEAEDAREELAELG